MAIREVTYYQIICDEPGCGVTTGDFGDYGAWSDRLGAIEDWEGSDGWVSPDQSRTYCLDHVPVRCTDCEAADDLTEHDGEPLCPEHLRMVKAMAGESR